MLKANLHRLSKSESATESDSGPDLALAMKIDPLLCARACDLSKHVYNFTRKSTASRDIAFSDNHRSSNRARVVDNLT